MSTTKVKQQNISSTPEAPPPHVPLPSHNFLLLPRANSILIFMAITSFFKKMFFYYLSMYPQTI